MPAKILIIEDNPNNLQLMVYLLRTFGHHPTGVADAAEGLATASTGDFDLILSDILMPGLDGFELARRLKADEGARNIPLVAVTALAMVGDRDRVLAAGFDGYIAKPIDPQTFVLLVDEYLPPGSRATAAAVQHPAASALSVPDVRGPIILAIDDVKLNRELIRSALEPFGYRVVDADGLGQAKERLRRMTPALILCDVHMIDGDGYQLLREVKSMPALGSVPFVFLTSSATYPAMQRKGLALGAAAFVLRPIDPASLLDAVRQALAKAGGDDPRRG
jgi:two-component system, cell cycle response regulator